MKTEWIPTDQYYHEIIVAPDSQTREQLYLEKFVTPWQAMMTMVSGGQNDSKADPLAGARAWGWLLPDQLSEPPEALRLLEAADAWTVAAAALAEGAARFAPHQDRLQMETVSGWLVLADAARADPIGRGYTGAMDWTQPRVIGQFDAPNDYNIPRLPGLVVHEFHHLVRLKCFPWDMFNTSVADYIILEGLAESFAAALYGEEIVGYYVTDFNEAELDTAKALIQAGLDKTGFNIIRGYIFGDPLAEKFHFEKVGGMPAYGGYAIGYRIVQAYLKRTGQSIEQATFTAATEIVSESGFFA